MCFSRTGWWQSPAYKSVLLINRRDGLFEIDLELRNAYLGEQTYLGE